MNALRWPACLLGRHTLVADSVCGVLLALLALPSIQEGKLEHPEELAIALVLLQTLPVAVQRRAPFAALGLTSAALFVAYALGLPATAGLLGPAIAAYSVAARRPRPASLWAAAVSCVAALASPFVNDGSTTAGDFFAVLALYAVPWLVGSRIRASRTYTAELEERAARLERQRTEEAKRAVSEERARLARELHDVVSHAVSVAVVQAGAAGRVLRTQPDQAAEHVAAIEAAGRQAMGELRRLLGVLRENGGSPEPLAPRPGLAELPALVAHVREAGLPVDLAFEGETRQLPVSLDLSAYRIVQEALTNTLRHAGPARARVLIRYLPDGLEITASDGGRGAPPGAAAQGHGLAGMRERVALFGGTMTAGSRPGGGFEVHVHLPLEPSLL